MVMSALAARYLNDVTTLAQIRRDAESLPSSIRDQVNDAATLSVMPSTALGINQFQTTEAVDLHELVAEAIWEAPLDESLLARQVAGTIVAADRSPQFDERFQDAELVTSLATVTDDIVFVNEGYRITAHNRLTGQKIWHYSDRTRRTSVMSYDSEPTLDLNTVTVDAGALVTLTGHAYALKRSGEGAVVCLDPKTGEERWRTVLAKAGLSGSEEREAMFPHGTPVIHEGRVYVLGRKVSKQFLTSTYAVALDLADGTVQWHRHICSSGALRRSGRPMSSLVVRDGDMFVATAVGAIARLDAGTGQIRWLQRFWVPISNAGRIQSRKPWEISVPIVTDTEIIALQPDQTHVVVLDRETGEQLERHACRSADRWNSPRYLLSDGKALYAIGEDIRAFRLGGLDFMSWQFPPPAREIAPGEKEPRRSLRLRGRVQIAQDALVVPNLENLLILDPEMGTIRHELDMPGVGNPLATGAQLLVVDGDRLRSFMPFSRAESMLRGRIAELPTDPEPALSLMRLGTRVENFPLVLEAGEMAAATLDRVSDDAAAIHRANLFYELGNPDTIALAEESEPGEALFALMGRLASTPDERVRHLLLRSDWRASHDLSLSIAGYHDLLDDPVLAAESISQGDIRRTARAWVLDRLYELRADHGGAIFDVQERAARTALDAQASLAADDPAALRAIALRYPVTAAGISAAMRATDALADTDPSAALLLLRELDHHRMPPEWRMEILGGRAFLASQDNRLRETSGMLARALELNAADRLPTPEGPRQLSAWWTASEPSGLKPRRPRAGAVTGDGVLHKGSVVPWHGNGAGRAAAPRDRILLFAEGGILKLYTSDEFQPVWTASLPQANRPQILTWTDKEILLWDGLDPSDPFAMSIDPSDGRLRWTSLPIDELIGEEMTTLSRSKPARRTLPDGTDIDLRETMPILMGDTIGMVRRDGLVLGVSRLDGETHEWTLRDTLEEVHRVVVTDHEIVLGGLARGAIGSNEMRPTICVMSREEPGEILHTMHPLEDAPIVWLCATYEGRVAVGTEYGIELLDPLAGSWIWSNVSYAGRSTLRGWPSRDHLIVEDRTNALRSFAIADGSSSGIFDISMRGNWDPMNLLTLAVDGDRHFALYRERLVRYSPTGDVEGADVVTDDRKYMALLTTDETVTVVSEYKREQQMVPDRAGRRVVRLYRVYTFSENGRIQADVIELPPLSEPLTRADLIDGWLLMSTSNSTIAMPAPATAP